MDINESQEQELKALKHQIAVAKLQRELEEAKMWLPIKVDESAAAKQKYN